MDKLQIVFGAFSDKANLIWGALLALLAQTLGKGWVVLPFFLLLNILDFYYGRRKAKATQTLSSGKGAKGIEKKVSYWIVIALAFCVSGLFADVMGPQLGIDLGFLRLIGWFTLAVYILNELTSILENMLVLGIDVPEILIRGLAVARRGVNAEGDKQIPLDKASQSGDNTNEGN